METINGYLQEEPEIRFTPSGKAITNLRISDVKAEENYEKHKKVLVWEEVGEKANEILNVNDLVYLKGYWKLRTWDKLDGTKGEVNEFTANQIWLKEEEKFFDIMEAQDNEDCSKYVREPDEGTIPF